MTDRTALQKQAASLARDTSPEALGTVFYGGGAIGHSDELRAMVVHELALAGHDVLNHPVVGRWARLGHWRHHGLGWLPIELTDFEKPDPRAVAFDEEWEGLLANKSVGAAGRNLEIVETTTEDFATRAGLPFTHWAEHSNGKIDAHEYLAADPVRDDDLRDLLAHAAPAFLAGGDARTLRAIPVTLRQVWTRLYQAGSGSSFYGPRQGGAHGRLHAWQAIAALTAAPTAATPNDVATLARACRWFALDITSAWFWDVWWLSDVTLACVGPEPERVAVIAATDTD
ncbi:DUF6183 family protein [Promicromonospora kroppenstedtii]|uniref:DUF6183 family protein n=1 Tax=Promicromonospora kroppenstedtii TaxID=440482 RepID=UPI0004BC06CB|nr:DUF6183 family protein [Promicromonospora kroppenstedtii]